MKHFRMALRFMTRYPVAASEEFLLGDFGRCTGYFPLVGLFAGLDLMLLRWVALFDRNGLHYPIWCFLLLLLWIWGSDSLHLDGLADTTDALASRRQGAEFLAILHDSRVGAFGAMALGLVLIGKFAWLCSLPMQGWWFLPLPLVFSRLHSSLACQIRPYAGTPGSLSSFFINESTHADLNIAVATALASFFLLAGLSLYLGFTSAEDAAKAFGVCIAGLALGRSALWSPMARLGGISGDLIGWSQVITETAIAFGLTLVLVR
jgi:adenosylcobinamide-GDP ribazoletransferase